MSEVQASRIAPREGVLARFAASAERAVRAPSLGLIGLLLLFAAWALGTRLAGDGLVQRFAPGAALAALADLVTRADTLHHVTVSLTRVLVGLGLAFAVGVPLGLLVGRFRAFEAATTPAFQLLRMISPLSWMPIAVMAFGVGDKPIYFLLAFAAVWPILLGTASGVRQLDHNWLQLARSLAATRRETLLHVVLPGILGDVLTGVRLAIGVTWIVLVPCEMLGVSAGLGYIILDTRDRLAYSELTATVLLIGLLGFALDTAARWLHGLWAPGRGRS